MTGNTSINNPKIIRGWALYDWANSVYNLVITSTIFPAYYEAITANKNNNEILFFGRSYVNTALYNYVLAIAFVIIALMSPILSSIADYNGNKRSFLRFFSTLGSVSCSLLYFFSVQQIEISMLLIMLACIGFWSSLVFYNSYLPEIASEEKRDDVSAKGFTYGYIGSIILQLLCFVVVFKKEWFGIAADNGSLPAKISFVMVGIWWFGFSQIPLTILPKGTANGKKSEHNLIKSGFIELKKVWLQLKEMKVLKQFLFSYFFYNMGVQTVMLVATLFGSKELKMGTSELITTILLIQIIAIPGAIFIAKLSDKIGNIKALCWVIVAWILFCLMGYFVNSAMHFYILAAFIGFVMGGIQSLSRSTYSKMIPAAKDTTSFFSFFDVTEKIAIAIGLLSYGYIEEITGSMRNSIIAVMLFFIIGFLILIPLRNKKISAA